MLLKKIDHPFVASFYELLEDSENYYLVFEYTENGNITDLLRNSPMMEEPFARKLFIQILLAVDYIKNMVGDLISPIKLPNIYLDKENNIRIMLIPSIEKNKPSIRKVASDPTISEAFMASIKTNNANLGAILYNMTVGPMPFDDKKLVMIRPDQLFLPPFTMKATSISNDLKDLISFCFTSDSNSDFIEQILNHPWIRDSAESSLIDRMNCSLTRFQFITDDHLDWDVIRNMIQLGIKTTDILTDLKDENTTSCVVHYKILKRENVVTELSIITKPLVSGIFNNFTELVDYKPKRRMSAAEKLTKSLSGRRSSLKHGYKLGRAVTPQSSVFSSQKYSISKLRTPGCIPKQNSVHDIFSNLEK